MQWNIFLVHFIVPILVLSTVNLNSAFLATDQNITVTGQLACDRKAVQHAEIELREHDPADPDDLLNTTTSDRMGHFSVFGHDDEIFSVAPYVRIIHNCDGGRINPSCIIIDEIKVPKHLIGGTYNMGIVSLNIVRDNHKKDCH
ncbi:hypothetical protein AB6A40_001673 [Gnathostoma spinigerum]|uniref:Transthyretin-like family protein n=1 Tax=Gnathostoma spinigerum TaxID=75299 RepID=A0ABD6E9Z2_9BILA